VKRKRKDRTEITMSGNYGEPDWITPGASTNAAATQEEFGAPSASTMTPEGVPKDRSNLVQKLLSICNCGLAVSMCSLGVLGFMKLNLKTLNDYSEAFICVYMILFATLLFLYELMWWATINSINKVIRMNFGFMYGMKGKGCFLIFIAFLAIGLDTGAEQWLRYFTGIAFLAGGFLHVFLVCYKPDLVENYKAPTGGLEQSDEVDYNHPV